MRGAVMTYLRPTSAPISSSWQDHKNRKPPSQEPGTDYACVYGTTLVAPANGRIVSVQTSTAGATGRFLTIDLDDGRRIRWLHLSAILVGLGARVSAGQTIARSGASAWGREWGVGAHVHVSLFPSHSYGGFGTNSTLDFERYVGGAPASSGPGKPAKPKPKPKPDPLEDDMEPIYVYNKTPYDRVYAIHPITGKKRAISKAEWEGAKLKGARAWEASKKQVDEIPNA